MTRLIFRALVAFCLLLPAVAAAQNIPPPDRAAARLSMALDQARGGDWASARGTARMAGPLAEAVIDWHRLSDGHGDWREAVRFLERYPDWPGRAAIRRTGERSLARGAPPEDILAYFESDAPATSVGALTLVVALETLGELDRARDEAVRMWREMRLDEAVEAALLARHAGALAPHHTERLDMLLWEDARAAAERMLPRVDEGQQRLGQARLALQAREPGVDARVAAVPDSLAGDAGLAWARFDWRMQNGRHDAAAELLLERSAQPDGLGRPEQWARWRTYLVRQALGDGRAQRAYELAAGHGLDGGASFADLEWLAGFIALRHLDRPETALGHFQTLRVNVSTPISLGRAGYWEGRAHDAMGDSESARAAYAFGAEHQTSFYGLLAAERAGIAMDAALAGEPEHPNWTEQGFAEAPLFRAAMLLRDAGRWHLARRFILQLAFRIPVEELGSLGDLALALDEPNWAVNIGKIAASSGVMLARASYPVTDLAEMDLPAPRELTLAIARRESEFDAGVVSPADARGLMQVLPGTGEMMARRLGIDFVEGRMLSDPVYNARLGAAYLDTLSEEFGTAAVLLAAAYNAGPGRPRRWVQELGDPRDPSVDPVDWIESVPFAETRNYIMRVMESLFVYRARLSGEPVEITLYDALNGS